MIEHWSSVYNINFISLRLFNVYGTRSRTHVRMELLDILKAKLSNNPYNCR